MSGVLREGEHPEKSEISGNLPIVVAPEAPHTIRYVSMDWSRRVWCLGGTCLPR